MSIDGNEVKDPGRVSNLFNDFFLDAPKKTISQIGRDGSGPLDITRYITKNNNRFFLAPLTEDKLVEIMRNELENKCSASCDEVPLSIIKKVHETISKPLLYLINLSFQTGRFPTKLKIGRVVLIFKNDNPRMADNYRPVSVSSSFANIFEYSFLIRFSAFLKKFDVIIQNQHGFLSGRVGCG